VAVGIAALAVLMASCSSADVLATVNGRPIYESDILSLRQAYTEGDPDLVSGEAVRQDLTARIYALAFTEALEEDFEIPPPTPAQIEGRLADPPLRWAALFSQLSAQNPDATDDWFQLVAENSIIRDAAVVSVLEEQAGLEDIFSNQRTLVTQTCTAHIVVGSIQEGQAVLERLAAGEAFDQLATELSLDTSSPGGLLVDPDNPQNCVVSASRFVPEFANALVVAPVGEPFGPVETDFGWHVILVLQRNAPETLEVFAADPLAYLDPGYAANVATLWEDNAVGRADIRVASELGRWNPGTDGIVPPDDATVFPVSP
jgi:hypothetical protein